MTETSYGDFAIGNRDEFQGALQELLLGARSAGVHIGGAYEAKSVGGLNLRIEITEMTEKGYQNVSQPDDDRPPNDLGSVDITSRTSLVQVLTGLPVQEDETIPTCSRCESKLKSGSPVTVYCRKPIEDFRWRVRTTNCRDCDVGSLESPGFGQTDVLVKATLADANYATSRRSIRTLGRVRVIDYSPPSEGSV
jgi:hypothetical protein